MDAFSLLRPILFISRAVGLAPFTVEKHRRLRFAVESRWLLCYGASVLGMQLVILARELIKEASYELFKIREPLWSTVLIVKILTFFMCTANTGNAVFKVSCTIKVLNIINALLKSLKVTDCKKYLPFFWGCILLNLFLYLLCFVHSFIWYFKVGWLLQLLSLYSSLFFLNIFTLQFVLITYLMQLVYKKINTILLSESRQPNTRRLLGQIKKFRKYDIILKDTKEIISSIFMPFILSYISWIYTAKIHGIMWFTQLDFSWVSLILYSFYYDGQVVFVLSACCSASYQAEKTANYLHELFIDNDDPDLKEEIEIFSLQLLHRKVEFNACGFFKLDFSLLYSMVGAVTTYIVILMQFQGNSAGGYGNCTAVNCTNCSV